jgi:hypothetical protein
MAKRVHIDKEATTLIDGAGEKKDIEARIGQIKAQIEETTSDYDREAGTAGQACRWRRGDPGWWRDRGRGKGEERSGGRRTQRHPSGRRCRRTQPRTHIRKGEVRALAETRATVHHQLRILEKAGLADVPPASGALYFFLRLRSRLKPLAYATRLIREHGVALIPGDAFGLAEGCHLRIAYGALQPATALEGIGRLVAGVQALSADNLT